MEEIMIKTNKITCSVTWEKKKFVTELITKVIFIEKIIEIENVCDEKLKQYFRYRLVGWLGFMAYQPL